MAMIDSANAAILNPSKFIESPLGNNLIIKIKKGLKNVWGLV